MYPPVYVIHCPELPERSQACQRHLLERGVIATFWRGFHGKSWGVYTALEYDPGKHISPGHVGLNMGTWALWQHIHESSRALNQDDPVIILEDDAKLPERFGDQVNDLLLTLQYDFPEWDLVFLGLAETIPKVWHKVTERVGRPTSNLCVLNDPFGTHAYMVRRRALPVLLDNMAVAQRNLDQQLFERVLKPKLLKWCAVLPSMVEQRTFDYTGTGKPEWAPSTIDAGADAEINRLHKTAMQPVAAHEHEVKRLLGVDIAENPTPEEIAATSALVDPLPCIYRGEYLTYDGFDERGRSIPLAQCAYLNKPCYAKPGRRVEKPAAVSCETCTRRSAMHGRDRAAERLPLPDGHFNPSMIRYGDRLILATRDSWGHSKVALWELSNTKTDWTGDWSVTPIGSFASDHPQAPRLEDPRLFTMPVLDRTIEPRLCAMFNLPDGYPPKYVKVGYCVFKKDLSGIERTVVFDSPINSVYEKNWMPFFDHDAGELRWGYQFKPEHVVLGESEVFRTPNPLAWTGGALRGGATPVMVTGGLLPDHLRTFPVFYHFFHGCLKRTRGNVYTMGCAVFDARPPYRVLRQTAVPLAWPDLPGPGESVVKRYVLWPGGAVPHAGAWHIACGVDDTYVRIIRIPFETVETALSDKPESDTVTSIRQTPIVQGITRG